MAQERKRILIADDNRNLRMIMCMTLSETYQVKQVGDATTLEKALNEEEFDLLIADLNLPKGSATEILRRSDTLQIGKHRIKGWSMPTLVVTGMDPDDEEVRAAHRMVSVFAVLHKPIDMALLRHKVDEALATPWHMEAKDACLNAAGTRKVLVVDDSLEFRQLIASILDGQGIETRTCGNPIDALRLCAVHRFDLMLLDFVLEGCMGDEVLLQMTKHLPVDMLPRVLIVSGFGDALDPELARRFPNVKGIICKPFDVDTMVEQVDSLIGAKQAAAAV